MNPNGPRIKLPSRSAEERERLTSLCRACPLWRGDGCEDFPKFAHISLLRNPLMRCQRWTEAGNGS